MSAGNTISPPAPLRPCLGVLGGGQLGRMFVHAAQVAGYRVAVLEPDAASPAGAAADRHWVAQYLDAEALDSFAAECTAVTTEFENVPADALRQLADRTVVAPPADAVRVCQHRALEKACFEAAGVPCAPYARVHDEATLAAAGERPLFPGLLKTATLGYDGKGQHRVDAAADLPQAWQALGRADCVLEQRLPLAFEVSVIVARGRDGVVVHLPVQQNLHRDGILAVTQVPAPVISPQQSREAVALATRLATELRYVGVLCVEFFGLADGRLVANEMAPRPHNSGHYSIDACDVSQFDLQLRTLVGLPLVSPRQHSAAVMLNLLGDLWFPGPGAPAREPDWPAVLALPGVRLHLYGKAEPRRARKMGHLTVIAARAEEAMSTARQAASRLGLAPF